MWSKLLSISTVRQCTFARKSCITSTLSTNSAKWARSSSRSSKKCLPARAPFSARTEFRPRFAGKGKERKLAIIDATCPLVTKVHLEAVKFAREGYTIILIGHKNHDEVIGTLGEAPAKMILVESVDDVDALNIEDPSHVAYLTQTTLSLDETKDIVARLEERFPMIRGPKSQDICYATENRQMAVKGVSEFCELILVVGSANSSNSKRLVEVGQNYGVQAYLVNDWSDVHPEWLEGITSIGVTAGASAPEHLVEKIVAALDEKGFRQLEEVEMVEEDVRFSLPPELASAASFAALRHYRLRNVNCATK